MRLNGIIYMKLNMAFNQLFLQGDSKAKHDCKTLYCGIILIHWGQRSWIVNILLVRGEVISWATGLICCITI